MKYNFQKISNKIYNLYSKSSNYHLTDLVQISNS